MKKLFISALLLSVIAVSSAEAQYYGPRVVRRYPPRYGHRQSIPPYDPTVNVTIGYGFPNLDKYYLPDFYNTYKGSTSFTGPFMGAIDYQFSRFMSVGVMATHGTVNTPYYYYGTNNPAFTGKLDNWSVMLDLVRYLPSGPVVSPYFRTAIGVNIWNQNFVDPSGNKAVVADDPSVLAYQLSFGAKFNLSKKAGLFVEAGFGKYILNTGLSFKF